MSSHWRHQGRCFGRIIHFVYHYCGFDAAEHCRIGDGRVTLHGPRIASFAWSTDFGEADVPVFTFVGERAEEWFGAQREKREAAVVDALPTVPAKDWQPLSADQIHAFNPDIERRAMVWSGIVAKAEPIYFTAGKALYFSAGGHYFYWSRRLGEWLRAAASEGGT